MEALLRDDAQRRDDLLVANGQEAHFVAALDDALAEEEEVEYRGGTDLIQLADYANQVNAMMGGSG